jgi:diphosphomevalonate decarboxylase
MRAHAVAQPNIALIKYWGKRNIARNLPATGSISLTLDALWTRMSVEFCEGEEDTLTVNASRNSAMQKRVSQCLDQVLGTERPRSNVLSESNFAIAAGLASSSSAFAALVMAASRAARRSDGRSDGQSDDTLSLARLAGRASGSAARSFFGGIVELSAGEDEIDVFCISRPGDWPLRVVIAITESGPKAVGSGAAMIRSADSSPFYESWISRQDQDLDIARQAIVARDFEKLALVSEHNCLKMHSVMWASRPPIVYWNEATLNVMETVRELRRGGVPVFFTIDAGPQVKAVCLPEACAAVHASLAATPGVREVLVSGLGNGARPMDEG